MRFLPTPLAGAFVIEAEPSVDERGHFARTWCRELFARHGLNADLVQCNSSRNVRTGTLRGLHYQEAPHAEAKLIRCVRGAVYDVAVDLRPGSATYGRWFGLHLDDTVLRQFYIPEGFAHGYITLCDDAEVTYQVSAAYAPQAGRGLRWDDPAVGIEWPMAPIVLSEKDRALPLLADIGG